MKNITYILGAGASCKAMPLVSDMKQRMQILLHLLNPKNTLNSLFSTIINDNYHNTQSLFDKYNTIVQAANKHYTPDTYAKKLWLTGKTNDLIIFKEFLNLYFIFEQDSSLIFIDGTEDHLPNLTVEESKILWNKITTPIDYRYDVFFATLLEGDADNLILPSNINVISWNYDNQFELAYKEYTKFTKMHEIHNILGINTKYNSKRTNILKINGYCDNWDGDKEIEISFKVAIEKLLNNESFGDTIRFGWEKVKTNYDEVFKILSNTDILVIIGYSFPNFNRELDNKLFSHILNPHNIEIIIQVPEKEEFEKIKQRILLMNEYISRNSFTHFPDKDQFYVLL